MKSYDTYGEFSRDYDKANKVAMDAYEAAAAAGTAIIETRCQNDAQQTLAAAIFSGLMIAKLESGKRIFNDPRFSEVVDKVVAAYLPLLSAEADEARES